MCIEDVTYRKYGGQEETSWWNYQQLAQGWVSPWIFGPTSKSGNPTNLQFAIQVELSPFMGLTLDQESKWYA